MSYLRPLLIVVAIFAVLPALHPATVLYLDNPSHLTEVAALSREILPEDRWFTGWTVLANAGFAVNQVNAPLLWVLVAMLDRLGLPPNAVYMAGAMLANVVYALGAARLAERLTGDRWVAFLAAAFSAACPSDLYGFAGAIGGMWPHRMANGLLLFGLASRRRDAPSVGIWLAVILLCHTYSGMAAAALVAGGMVEAAWRREPTRLLHLLGGAVLGALASSPFWFPLLETAVRPILPGGPRFWSIQDTLVWLLLPMNPVRLAGIFEYWYIGDYWGFPLAMLVLFGLGVAIRTRPVFADMALARRLGLFVGLLFVAVAAVVPLSSTLAFGPNPWRQLTLVRYAISVVAAMGLAPLLPRPLAYAAVILGALLTSMAGVREMGLPVDSQAQALHAELRAAWDSLERLDPPGNVYHQNTNINPNVHRTFAFSQAGALPPAELNRPTIGTWYAVTPIVSEKHTRSERLLFFGRGHIRYTEDPGALMRRIRAFRVGALVTVDTRSDHLLRTTAGLSVVSQHGPFAVWKVDEPDMARIALAPIEGPAGLPTVAPAPEPHADDASGDETGEATASVAPSVTPSPADAAFTEVSWARGRLVADLQTSGPTGFLFRETWHPWWRATLDGRPLVVLEDRATGLVYGVAPGPGRLELVWTDNTRWTTVPAVITWIGLLIGLVWVRRRAA